MARRRGPILVLVSLVLALLAAWVANTWLSVRSAAKTGPTAESVVTAALDMPLGTRIKAEQVAVIEVPPGTAPKGSFQRVDEVIGQVTSTAVVSGEILLAQRLSASDQGSALASVVDRNMRAVTVRVDDMVGVSGFLEPGNRVDVIATKTEQGSGQVRATTILSNIKVIAADQTQPQDRSQPVVVRAVTLMVSPSDAELLLRGRAAGQIQLTLRNPLDQSDARTREPQPEPVKVVQAKPKVARVSAPEIMVIRGTQLGAASQKPSPN
jgi:pilus assembly protein CpaB